jgi:hypothetical protein
MSVSKVHVPARNEPERTQEVDGDSWVRDGRDRRTPEERHWRPWFKMASYQLLGNVVNELFDLST